MTTEERNHHNWLLSFGNDRLGRLIDNILNGKSRLITLIELNLVFLTVFISTYPLIWEESDFKLFLWIPIGLSIFSIIISLYRYNRKAAIIEILSYKEKDFNEYETHSEKELYGELLKNLKEGLKTGQNLYESIVKFYWIAFFAFNLSIILYIIMSFIVMVFL